MSSIFQKFFIPLDFYPQNPLPQIAKAGLPLPSCFYPFLVSAIVGKALSLLFANDNQRSAFLLSEQHAVITASLSKSCLYPFPVLAIAKPYILLFLPTITGAPGSPLSE